MAKRTTGDGPNPSGLCMCGCGGRTRIAPYSSRSLGWVFRTPIRYIRGHENRSSPVEYVEQDTGYATPCWVWQRAKTAGYGVDGRGLVHRTKWEAENGPVPEGLELDHLCANRGCVRPSHLEAVTHAENDRRGNGTRLTMSDAREIRARRAAGEAQIPIASDFGISVCHVSNITTGRVWAE